MRLWWLTLVASAGCGVLSGLDNLSVDGGDGGASVDAADAADDSVSDAPSDVGSCEASTCGAPEGFQPVLFASDRATPCPTDSTTLDAVFDPQPPLNACTCTCNYQPACFPQTLVYQYGNTTCNSTQVTPLEVDGGCNSEGFVIQAPVHVAVGPFPPTNACTNALKTNGKATSSPARVCSISSCSTCAPPTGFALCFSKTGDVPCLSSASKHLVGSDTQLACGACTACSSTATCRGTMQLFGDYACSTNQQSVTADGTCQSTSNGGIGSVKYLPAVDQGMCTPGTSAASATLTAPMTVCCP
jgi:hypothetical protein